MTEKPKQTESATDAGTESGAKPGEKPADKTQPTEIGGRAGPEPTRYGDWEKNGIISDF